MSEPERPLLLRNIVPAATGFSVTFAAGMAATVFVLTGGFPDSPGDRPAMVWENAPVSAEPTQLAIANSPAPPAPVTKRETRDETPEPAPSALDAAAPARFKVELDTESLDSILADGEAINAVDNSDAGPDDEALRGRAFPPEVVEDLEAAPDGEAPPEMWGWEAR